MTSQLKQGDIRTWEPGVREIGQMLVRVCGVASNGVPVLGLSYIVEPLSPIEGYEYSHAVAFECHLK